MTNQIDYLDCSDFGFNFKSMSDLIENPCKVCLDPAMEGKEMCQSCYNFLDGILPKKSFMCGQKIVSCFYCDEYVAVENEQPYQNCICASCIEKGEREKCPIFTQIEPPKYTVRNNTLFAFDVNYNFEQFVPISEKVFNCKSCNKCREDEINVDDTLLNEMIEECKKQEKGNDKIEVFHKDAISVPPIVSENSVFTFDPLFTDHHVYTSEKLGKLQGVEDGDEFLVVVYKRHKTC